MTLIEFLTTTNQSLLNQVRAKDVSTLAGLNTLTGEQQPEQEYISTDDRELEVYRQYLAQMHEVGEVLDDDEIEAFRSAL